MRDKPDVQNADVEGGGRFVYKEANKLDNQRRFTTQMCTKAPCIGENNNSGEGRLGWLVIPVRLALSPLRKKVHLQLPKYDVSIIKSTGIRREVIV